MTKNAEAVGIGHKIAAVRKAAGMTQAALATALETTITTISRWECGRTDIPASALERVAKATGHRLELRQNEPRFKKAKRKGASRG